MTSVQGLKAVGATVALSGLLVTSIFVSTPRGRTRDRDDDKDPRIEQGFDIAPVHLNLEGTDRNLVGLGSYLVNTGGCNDCHDTGPPNQFVMGGNPFFLGRNPKQINPKTYMGGGRNFGKISGPPSPDIICRNLTPST